VENEGEKPVNGISGFGGGSLVGLEYSHSNITRAWKPWWPDTAAEYGERDGAHILGRHLRQV
jgi:hypothetical protein